MHDSDRALELYDRARHLEELGDMEAALPLFQASATLAPHFKTFELAGNCLREMERSGEAVVYLAAAATLGPKQCRCRFLLARALSSLGRVEQANAFLDECLEVNPGNRVAVVLRDELMRSS
jgi:tetratricopeptide (TPR) repeat protein